MMWSRWSWCKDHRIQSNSRTMANTENLRPWKPGQSGNPGGRLRGSRDRLTITVAEVPRVVQLVRAVVLTIREQQGPRSPVAAPRHSHRGKERRKSGDYRPSATPHCGPWLQRALPSTPGRPAGGRANAQAAIEAPASGQRGPRVRFSGLQATTAPPQAPRPHTAARQAGPRPRPPNGHGG